MGLLLNSQLYSIDSFVCPYTSIGLPWWLSGKKNLPASAGDSVLISGSERSPGEENGNPLQYSCLGDTMDRGAWGPTVHGDMKEFDMT